MKKTVQYIFRMDDITPDMNWEKFNRVRSIFEKYDIFPLLGVVPDNCDEKLSIQDKRDDFFEIIKGLQAKGWTIAQHGTFHRYVTNDPGLLGIKSASEFAGLPYKEQFIKLQKGKEILEENGVFSDIFMAPGHTFDRVTLKALTDLGFHTVTDGLYYRPYIYKGLLFVPCRLQGYRNKNGTDTICLHVNTMTEEEINELDSFCKRNLQTIVPFEVSVIQSHAIKRTLIVVLYEKEKLLVRKIRNCISNSKRLAWYLEYTNDTNSKRKWMKRVFYLPILCLGRKERK